MNERAREHLERCFDDAASMGLEPSWHDDEHGFDFDCPTCAARGDEHRVPFRLQPLAVLVFKIGNQAKGPAS